MHGPQILTRTLSIPAIESTRYGNLWQYHSRSNRHSKIACWGLLFDLVRESPSLRRDFENGAVVFSLNHEMRDFKDQAKKLDLVVAKPAGNGKARRSFLDLVDEYGIRLRPEEVSYLEALPPIEEALPGAVRIAFEAKACMTEHVKALPRLNAELASSHRAIHGAANQAIALGLTMVNIAEDFVSPDLNKFDLDQYPAQINEHDQPQVAERVLKMLHELPRRTGLAEEGFDAFGIVVIECRNDGSLVRLWEAPPAPQKGETFHYESMIRRAADLYDSRYGRNPRSHERVAGDRKDKLTEADVLSEIEAGETKHREFKSSLRWNLHTGENDDRITHAALKTIAAFQNTEGGVLYLGVEDDGTICGIEHDGFASEDKLLLHLAQVVKSWMGKPAASRLDPKTWTFQGRTICRVECPPSPQPVFLKFRGEERFYVRSGPSTEEMSPSEMHAYVGERFEG